MRHVALVVALVTLAAVFIAQRPGTTRYHVVPADATKAAWYLKGEGDAALGPRGWTISRLHCAQDGVYVNCRMRLNSTAASSLCATGRFRLTHFAVTGQWRTPHACSPSA